MDKSFDNIFSIGDLTKKSPCTISISYCAIGLLYSLDIVVQTSINSYIITHLFITKYTQAETQQHPLKTHQVECRPRTTRAVILAFIGDSQYMSKIPTQG